MPTSRGERLLKTKCWEKNTDSPGATNRQTTSGPCRRKWRRKSMQRQVHLSNRPQLCNTYLFCVSLRGNLALECSPTSHQSLKYDLKMRGYAASKHKHPGLMKDEGDLGFQECLQTEAGGPSSSCCYGNAWAMAHLLCSSETGGHLQSPSVNGNFQKRRKTKEGREGGRKNRGYIW